jgi:hypothetical protein
MRAALLKEIGAPFEITDVPEPQIGPDEVLVRTKTCGICRTDLHIQDGLAYIPSLPHVPGHEPAGVVELPVEWVRDDAVYFSMHRFSSLRPYTPPTDVLDIFRRELDAAWEDGGVFQLTMHPHIIGYRSRIWIVDELIRHAKAKGKVWFATHEEVARYAKEHAA